MTSLSCAGCGLPFKDDVDPEITVFVDGKAYDVHNTVCLVLWAKRRRQSELTGHRS